MSGSAPATTFELIAARLRFTAVDPIHFAPGRAGNTVRGAFGIILRKLACDPACAGAASCDRRYECAYARIFEPSGNGDGVPSGFANLPRPFVFRASHLDGETLRPCEPFHFDLHVFDTHNRWLLPYYVAAFSELAKAGIGPGRGRAEFTGLDELEANGNVSSVSVPALPASALQLRPLTLDLRPDTAAVERVLVRYRTPTELKSGRELVSAPHFHVLFARIRDRLGALRTLYGTEPLQIDFRAMAERASKVVMTRCAVAPVRITRRSSRTGLQHPIGGFAGEAEYCGDLAEFMPYLRAARWSGVGRQTVWGKGEIAVIE